MAVQFNLDKLAGEIDATQRRAIGHTVYSGQIERLYPWQHAISQSTAVITKKI